MTTPISFKVHSYASLAIGPDGLYVDANVGLAQRNITYRAILGDQHGDEYLRAPSLIVDEVDLHHLWRTYTTAAGMADMTEHAHRCLLLHLAGLRTPCHDH